MPALHEVQAAVRRALIDDDDGAIDALIAADGMSAAHRVAVHRNNLRISLTDVLRDTFPAVCRLVDERFFAYAAHEFLTAAPPRRACLAEYGAGFADFLAVFPPCRTLAYLPDVARLEWLMNVAAHAADATPLVPSALAGVAAADTPRLVFRLAPSLAFLASPWPVDRIWRLNRPGADGDAIDLDEGGVRLEIDRRGSDVVLRALDAAPFALR
ncbi:MAG TPA: DNA-binding domain-containing protein, partial [Stellaceae bacterium]|nr:DNA-binding domain-containing protein [Stellaceae bacterium]